jgi:hypothetical protein
MRCILFLIINLFLLIETSFIPNIKILANKEMINYQKILEIQDIPCHLQLSRIKSFPSAFKKKNKFKLKTIYEVNDLLAYRFVFFDKIDLLKFYQHLFNEKSLVIVNNYISDNSINYNNSILFRYQNHYKQCPIFQIECQMFTLKDYYTFIYHENKEILYFKNINYPYND